MNNDLDAGIGTRESKPFIVISNYIERLRLTEDGWILIGGPCRGSAPIEINTKTGEVVINRPDEVEVHAKTFFECLTMIFSTMRAKWIEEERERVLQEIEKSIPTMEVWKNAGCKGEPTPLCDEWGCALTLYAVITKIRAGQK